MNIVLCCSVGMSSSLLVSKMKKSAEEQGIQCNIWAVPIDIVRNQIEKADVFLIAPHFRYLLPELKQLGEKKGIPVEIINTVHYGTFNGKEVLKFAEKLIALKQKG